MQVVNIYDLLFSKSGRQQRGQPHSLHARKAWMTSGLPAAACMTLGKLLDPSESQSFTCELRSHSVSSFFRVVVQPE